MQNDWTKIRSKVKSFIEEEIYPVEDILANHSKESQKILKSITLSLIHI